MGAPGSVSYDADFKADTSQGQQSLKDYQTQIKAVRAEIAQATKDAKDQYQQQMLSARAAGASQEQLAKIGQEYAQSQLAIKNAQKELTDEILQGNFSALESEEALLKVRQQAIAQIEQETVAARGLATANKSAHGAEVGGAIAGGSLIRTIDGGQNVRAVENFLAKTLGLGGVFQALFPIVGAVAMVQILGEMGEKLYDIREKAIRAGDAMRDAAETAHSKAEVTIHDLDVQADKLQLNIDKLSGHPGNGLKLALDEARVAADKIQASLLAARKEQEALFKEQHVGTFGSILSGVAGTGTQEKQMLQDHKDLEHKIEGINNTFNRESAQAKSLDDIRKAGDKRDAAIRSAVKGSVDTYRQESNRLRDEQTRSAQQTAANFQAGTQANVTVNNSAKIGNVDYAAGKYQDFLDVFDGQLNVSKLTEKENQLKGKKESDQLAKEGSRKALEAQKQAAEAQRKQWDDDHSAWETAGHRSAEDEITFWVERANQARMGSENYAVASKKADEFIKKANDERRKVFDEGLKMQREFSAIAFAGINGGALERTGTAYAKGQSDAARTGQELKQSQEDIALSTRQASIEFDAQHGVISRYDAAVQLQALHTEQYTLALQRLQEQLAAVQPGPQADAQRNTLQKQIGELDGKRTVQSMQDSASVAQTTVAGALKNANQQWLQNTQELAPQISNVYTNVISGMNDQLSNLLTGQKTSWSSFFRGIASSFAHIGLNQMEGMIVGALGPKSTTAGSSAASTGGSVLSGLVRGTFGGFRAGGGPVEAGKTYIVGEKGPEPVTFGSNATMGTNRDLQSMLHGGGGNPIHIAVDASGSGNPADVEAAAHRAVMAAVPHILAAGMQMQQERRDRMPSSQR